MSKYDNLNIDQLKQSQENLQSTTGMSLNGALGGLPVAEKNQAYFAIFDEAGDTGPEIIDKTQFRVTYVVDSSLNTSKPTSDSVAVSNITQNFEKGKHVLVRADNATVLNKEITDLQNIYDVGTLTLLSTSEVGIETGDFEPTMSFKGVNTAIGDVENIQGNYKMSSDYLGDNTVSNIGDYIQGTFDNPLFPIPTAATPYVVFSQDKKFILQQSTIDIGTRIKFRAEISVTARGIEVGGNALATVNLVKQLGSQIEYLESKDFTFSNPYASLTIPTKYTSSQNYTFETDFNLYEENTQFYIQLNYVDSTPISGYNITLSGNNFRLIQEITPGGESAIQGVNYTVEPYWEKIFQNVDNKYSIITASAEYQNFIQGDHIVQLTEAQKSYTPKNDGNTFHPIFTPLTYEPGDEIRFEYNPNKVYKIFKVEQSPNAYAIFVRPEVPQNTNIQHFTHYRIIPNGGYLIINQEKNNEAGTSQPFQGIILPQYPSEKLQQEQDNLIFKLKEAGIIQN